MSQHQATKSKTLRGLGFCFEAKQPCTAGEFDSCFLNFYCHCTVSTASFTKLHSARFELLARAALHCLCGLCLETAHLSQCVTWTVADGFRGPAWTIWQSYSDMFESCQCNLGCDARMARPGLQLIICHSQSGRKAVSQLSAAEAGLTDQRRCFWLSCGYMAMVSEFTGLHAADIMSADTTSSRRPGA